MNFSLKFASLFRQKVGAHYFTWSLSCKLRFHIEISYFRGSRKARFRRKPCSQIACFWWLRRATCQMFIRNSLPIIPHFTASLLLPKTRKQTTTSAVRMVKRQRFIVAFSQTWYFRMFCTCRRYPYSVANLFEFLHTSNLGNFLPFFCKLCESFSFYYLHSKLLHIFSTFVHYHVESLSKSYFDYSIDGFFHIFTFS